MECAQECAILRDFGNLKGTNLIPQFTLASIPNVVDIPNGYTSDVVSYRQTRVAHGGGIADSQPGGLVASGMAD
jgi:hypothetical protein